MRDGSGPPPSPPDDRVAAGEHVVREGESVDSIAFDRGFFPETIWALSENAELRKSRPNRNELLPGDRVKVPALEPKIEPVSTGKVHSFRRRGVPSVLRVQLLREGQPRAGVKYTLVIDGARFEGAADADGVIRHWVPPNAREGTLAIEGDPQTYAFKLGVLDPITEVRGVQKRLMNLGYDCGPLDGTLSRQTKAALRRFQRRYDLPETEAIDEATIAKLEEVHATRG
jgi:hypothetical protein